jgi:TPP-dependent pyruvate/acetoin dehydrogenase alpha subunit
MLTAVEIDVALKLLHAMKRIRAAEEGIAERYAEGKMRCPTHLSVGQEAAAAGVGLALEHRDLAVSTHRAHAHYLAKGGDLKAMLAEIYGKATGCCRGRGGSMHLIDRRVGFMGSTAIVGNSIPIGVGLALSLQLRRKKGASVVFLGDAAVEEGAFYESANFAVVRNLPVLFVCENNQYSVYSHLRVRQPEGRSIHTLVQAIGIPGSLTDGNDPVAVYQATQAGLAHIRQSGGPYFLELTTYRWREHCGPNFDNQLGYRSEEEFLMWKERDPIPRFEEALLAQGLLERPALKSLDDQIAQEIAEAFEFAERSPFPSADEAFAGLYAANPGAGE